MGGSNMHLTKLSDDEFKQFMESYEDDVDNYIINDLIYKITAFYVSKNYELDLLSNQKGLRHLYGEMIQDLSNLPNFQEFDIDKLNTVLRENYDLEIIRDNPIQIKKLK